MIEEFKAELDNEQPKIDLSSFSKVHEKMIATNERVYGKDYYRNRYFERVRDYTLEEIQQIISSGDLEKQQKLSRNYFAKSGYYKQIVLYYASLLKYTGVLIPNPAPGKNLSNSGLQKRYFGALDYVEKMSLETFCVNVAQRAILDGGYYGIIISEGKDNFSTIDLPYGYCYTRYKDENGFDIISFNLAYFDSIPVADDKNKILSVYPEFIRNAYKKWKKGKINNSWIQIPSDIGICLPFFDGHPFLLNVIPATIDYDEAIDVQKETEVEGIHKTIVQKIPHLTDGQLLFEPEEAEVMHQGAVGMLKGNKHISVLTTYADVDSIGSKTGDENQSSFLKKMEQNIYSQGGVSSEIFMATGSSTLPYSVNNDLALMMNFANKISRIVSRQINQYFANGNITFKYEILPITYQNSSDYLQDSFKLASSGYSFLVPALTIGLSQRDIVNIKELENDLIKLSDKLIPLKSSFTSDTGKTEETGEAGRPALKEQDKSPKTLANEKSLEKTT